MVVRHRPFSVMPATQRAFAVDGSLALAASPEIHAPVHPKRFRVLTGGLHQPPATAPKESSLLIAADALKTVNLILKRTPYLFHGERYDNALGMYYLRARYMEPNRSRFMTIDPFSGFDEEPMSLHRYLAFNANPVMYTDPSGKFLLEALVTAAIAATMVAVMPTSVNYLEGSFAWPHARQRWGGPDMLGYRNFVSQKYNQYLGKRVNCADLAITMLIDYASQNSLPVHLRGYSGQEFYSDRTEFENNKEGFLKAARDGLGANEIWELNTFEKGTLPSDYSSAASGDLLMKYGPYLGFGGAGGWVASQIAGPLDSLGLVDIPGHTRIFLNASGGDIHFLEGNLEGGGADAAVKEYTWSAERVSRTPSLRFWSRSALGY